MKQYTFEEWETSSTEERTKYIAEVMSKVKFDSKGEATNVEICRYGETKFAQNYRPIFQWGSFFYRIIEEPTKEQQFQELIKRKGFEVERKVKDNANTDVDYGIIIEITDECILIRWQGHSISTEYDYTAFNRIEKDFELLSEPTQEEITAKFIKDNNLKVGDKLKVVRRFESIGWSNWVNPMDKYIGKIGEVKYIQSQGIGLSFDDGDQWCFFPQSLEVYKYRYVPYSFEDDLLGLKIKSKSSGFEYLIIAKCDAEVDIAQDTITYEGLFEHYTHIDGSPCGKEIAK